MKGKDTVTVGTIAGVLATIPSVLANYLLVQAGFGDYYSFQISGGIFLHPELTNTTAGLAFGAVIWLITAAFVGAVLALFLKAVGREFWWVKGPLSVTMLMYIAVYGFLFNLGGAKIVPWDLPSNTSLLITNVLFGVVSAYLIVRWTDK